MDINTHTPRPRRADRRRRGLAGRLRRLHRFACESAGRACGPSVERVGRAYRRVPAEQRRNVGLLALALPGIFVMLTPALSQGIGTGAGSAETPLSAAAAPGGATLEAAPGAEPGTAPGAEREADAAPAPGAQPEPAAEPGPSAPEARSELVGFYVNWDESSYDSLAANIGELTIVMPEWYTIDGGGRVKQLDAKRQARAIKLIREKRPDLRVMPIVNNFGPGQDPKALAGKLEKRAARKRMAEDIVRTMRDGGFDGVNIDFEGLPASSRVDLVRFMRELYPLAEKHGLEVSADVLADSKTYDYEALARSSDYLIPMMYDEHWKTSPSGPVASQGWYERSLREFFSKVPPDKVVIALGSWTYDWSGGGSRAKAHTYASAMAEARKAGVPVKLDEKSLNPTFAHRKGGVHHRLWMLDAVTMFNQIKAASGSEPRGYAVWRLGAEDPSIWRILPKRDGLDAEAAASLETKRRSIVYDEERGLIVGARTAPR
ncbi:MAG: hypothetical protein IBX62_02950 [Coriobacteriia bacterium]|nr:hypothetical protein [Coriobacteriia bacterium]